MKIIGLCGQSGAGKTTALEEFLKMGFRVIDCDEISRFVTRPNTPCLSELESFFGEEIISPDKTLDRKRLAAIAFADGEKYAKLNEITHRHILEELDARLEMYKQKNEPFVIIDAPLLYESGLDKRCDKVIAVCADKEVRIKRITERDALTRDQALARISRQTSEEDLESLADFVVYNNGDLTELKKEINALVRKIGEEIE